MIPALSPVSGFLLASPPATFADVNLLLILDALPLWDTGNIGIGIANYGGTIDTGVKPSFVSGSFFTGAVTSHGHGAKLPELGSNFQLGAAFCVEAMVYVSTAGARIFDTRPALPSSLGWVLAIQATTLNAFFQVGTTVYGLTSPSPSGAVTANTWTHVRVTYDGTTLRIFIGGSLIWSAAQSINITTGSHLIVANTVTLGGDGIANQYLSNLRIVKGEAVSTISFIPPSASWPGSGLVPALQTNVTYSNVVLRSTYDSNVADQSTFARTMTANGGAASSSGVFKFGGGSLLLDGTGDYVTAPDSTDFDFSTGDYQFQCWLYRNGTKANDDNPISCYTNSSTGYSLGMNHTTFVPYWNETGDGIDGVFVDAVPNTTWTHVAVGRKNGILYTFVNGVLQRFISSSQTVNCAGTMFIGRLNNTFTTQDWLGSIDDLQLVKGECELFRTFLVPTSALPTS